MGEEFTVDGDLGIGELSPGSTPRRWEPEEGVTNLNHRIHRESRQVDERGTLDFTFSKPKHVGRRSFKRCDNCGHTSYVPINTVGIICNTCHSYASVKEV